MKNNIKTFPKGYAYPKEYIKWKEGFERELRERKLWLETPMPKHDVCCGLCVDKGELMAIKKVLGDS